MSTTVPSTSPSWTWIPLSPALHNALHAGLFWHGGLYRVEQVGNFYQALGDYLLERISTPTETWEIPRSSYDVVVETLLHYGLVQVDTEVVRQWWDRVYHDLLPALSTTHQQFLSQGHPLAVLDPILSGYVLRGFLAHPYRNTSGAFHV